MAKQESTKKKKGKSIFGSGNKKASGGKYISGKKAVLYSLIITFLVAAVIFYFRLPAINLRSPGFWAYLICLSVIFAVCFYSFRGAGRVGRQTGTGTVEEKDGVIHITFDDGKISRIPFLIPVVLIVGALLISFFGSSKLLHARAYSQILTVEEKGIENIPTVGSTDSIALMDTASAEKLGNREIGSLSNVVSQYNVGSYTQIDYQGTPVKTAPLVYAGFFKWNSNRGNGVPGYVVVNPVSMDADYVALEQGMKIVPSAYFGDDLERRMRFAYPTVMFGNIHFEIDEDGMPWYVASTYEHRIGLFGGVQVNGAIIVNPVDGSMQKLAIADVPTWADDVFDGNLICEQYNNYAQLHDGFWNSVIGQVGCRKVTEFVDGDDDDNVTYSDYGYIAKDGDIWIYTGVTSLNNDSSNIGFILSNERTEETYFIPCAGADEFSAMASAEGEVQEKGYTASFPSLILVDGNPTYIMVLKDDSGLVKMYAAVNVEQYNMVATATNQEDCIDKYRALVNGKITQAQATDDTADVDELDASVGIGGADDIDTSKLEEKTITVKKLETIDIDGNTYLYIVDEDDNIYRAKYADVLAMMLVEEGDEITIQTDGENYRYADETRS